MADNSTTVAETIAAEIEKIIKLAKSARMEVVVYVLETAKMEALRAGDNAKPSPGAATGGTSS
jgi:hypothetical protein